MRGLKYKHQSFLKFSPHVAPFTGAWIEISFIVTTSFAFLMSHPSRVRGLKSETMQAAAAQNEVAPFTGAWIEISSVGSGMSAVASRTLHGCVD